MDESQLIEIAGCQDDNRRCDVVFIHGLNGNPQHTWELPKPPFIQRVFRRLRGHAEATSSSKFWPDWLAEEIPTAGFWSLGYPAASTAWRGHAMPLTDRARNILQLFHLRGLGTRPVLLIVHSLGGLLAKQLLQTAYTQRNPDWEAVGQSIRGILFLATPHSGAFLASLVDLFRVVSRANWTIADLQPHEPHLRDLNEWFRSNFEDLGLRGHVLRETKKTSGVLVVDATSADPGIASIRVIPVDKSHITICTPLSRTDHVFLESRQFIEQCFSSPNTLSISMGSTRFGNPRPGHPIRREVPLDRIEKDEGEAEEFVK